MVGRDDSVDIATCYELEGSVIESQLGTIFFAAVQTSSGAHPASYTRSTRSFPGVNRPGRGINHLPLFNARIKKE
jgi:hypothetical protein